MLVGIMTTNGGPHPPEKWAVTTAGQIIKIGETAAPELKDMGRKIELKLLDVLEKHHGTVQGKERDAIEKYGEARLQHPLIQSPAHVAQAVAEHVDVEEITKEITAVADGTPFEAHFAKPEVKTYIEDLLRNHFGTSISIERDWQADRILRKDPAHKIARAFKDKAVEVLHAA